MNAAVWEYINGIEVIKAFNQSSASYGKVVAAVRPTGTPRKTGSAPPTVITSRGWP